MANSFWMREGDVVLALSREEAITLATVLGHVGGCPTTSLRRHSDSVAQELDRIGVPIAEDAVNLDKRRPGVYFYDNTRV